MTARKWSPVLLPFSVGLLGSEVYSSFTISSESWGQVLGSLYYIPIVIAAIVLGLRPALFVALAAGGAHTLAAALGHGDPWIEPAAQTLLFVCIALTAARLAQWRAEALRTIRSDEKPAQSLAIGSDNPAKGRELRALSWMIVGLARQFRTPLTSIEGAGWVLDDPKLPDNKRRELVGIVRKETHRLNRVLMDVLEFAQPRHPRFRMIDLSKLVEDVIQLAPTKDHGQPFTLSKSISPDVPELRGDPEQIRQVLLNLVMNSIQAMPEGGQIEISAHIAEDTFVITVRDHGTGIPDTALDHIFEPFFTTREHHLGLGLPLALRIVTEHRGKIIVDRQQSGGTCISIILPTQPASPILSNF